MKWYEYLIFSYVSFVVWFLLTWYAVKIYERIEKLIEKRRKKKQAEYTTVCASPVDMEKFRDNILNSSPMWEPMPIHWHFGDKPRIFTGIGANKSNGEEQGMKIYYSEEEHTKCPHWQEYWKEIFPDRSERGLVPFVTSYDCDNCKFFNGKFDGKASESFIKCNFDAQGMKDYEEIDYRECESHDCPYGMGCGVTSTNCENCKYHKYMHSEEPYLVHCTFKYKHKEQQMEKPTYEEQMEAYRKCVKHWEFKTAVSNGSEDEMYYTQLWKKHDGNDDFAGCAYCALFGFHPLKHPRACTECVLGKAGYDCTDDDSAYNEWHKNPTRENAQAMLDLIKRTKPVKEVEQEYCCETFKIMVRLGGLTNFEHNTSYWYIRGDKNLNVGNEPNWGVEVCPKCGKKPIPPIGK